ncbi:MAG: class I SAM-dependent methyltransferase [Pseudomonadota bacterium]
MRISCATMVKNEGAVIHEFASHLLELFDDIVFIDHLSTDGTAEFLADLAASTTGVHLVELRSQGYFQSATMTEICKAHPALVNADWVFLLDADEMLPFETRGEFETALGHYFNVPYIRLPWHNLVPTAFEDETLIRREFFQPKKPSLHRKIAIQPKLMSSWPVIIDQGNHEIRAFEGGAFLSGPDAFPVLHAPIRTIEQLKRKLAAGLKSYRDMGQKWDTELGAHWLEIEKAMESDGFDDTMANFAAARYGDPNLGTQWSLTHEEMRDQGYTVTVLHGALAPKAAELRDKHWPDTPGGETISATNWVEIDPDTGRAQLYLDGAPAETLQPASLSLATDIDRFDTLSGPHPAWRKQPGSNDRLLDFLAMADRPIECLTPTSWGGHIPFMYALVTQMRPRRVVELGSHNGASFFATCQALKSLEGPSQAVAIDLWEGDEHAGFYTEDVYRNFSHILRAKFSEVGTSVREDFTKASERFAPGSIDLLHIDGLHTYEAVKHDYETWLPKLADNATILFHDTNVYERGFGVWQFWDEIKDIAPSFNFHHTHGLGVLALGPGNPVAPILTSIHERQAGPLIERHFAHLGQVSLAAAQFAATQRYQAANKSRKAAPGPAPLMHGIEPALHAKKKKPIHIRVSREFSKGLRKMRGIFSGK